MTVAPPAPKAATKTAATPAAPAPAPVAPAAAPVEAPAASSFALDDNLPVPTVTRTIGQPSNYPLGSVNVGQSFIVPVAVADTITDEGERAKAWKEEARKVANRLSGAVRRFRESHEDIHFAIRTVNDDTLGHGVRVWRVAQAEGNAKA